ncbi:MAG: LysR family transcriptional regulator [Burkholderiaceae bacterium]|nr:LysR family transcriptional regulator [Burkholderiaceae bacterium]
MSPDLNDLLAFARVAECRSFRQAAQELQVTASALSHTMTRMEKKLGMRLLQRTTRSVSLTPAGERLLQSLRPALQEIQGALESLNDLRDKPVGRLRLNVPRAAAQLVIAPKLASWMEAYPDVQLDIVTDDGLIDIVAQGFDAGVRFGERLQQDMIAVPIGPKLAFSVCAAPSYLALKGVPKTPKNLLQHTCLQYRFPSGTHYAWEFQSNKKRIEVNTKGQFATDDFASIVRAAIDGAGICYTYDAYVSELVAQGQLQRILENWYPAGERMYLYYPSRVNLPLALRAFIDFFA